ncbi:hypothetical protein DDV21_010100 [Streptococcus chenjunshii]|uniref:Integron-associated effector binding protein domain-containing protein n=1 Tax=Streptococcus chenjunshii TaxID=2173853 RepID=A0A372KIS6_9STRE|nr:hypothetical protein [Streptococcus chenjunshii]AXQ79402.1 hypothetical protein DDV21_010100 [Streptococcus chenjunshii]RFU50015.1 hypothetical protein DDV22_10875 [Streptococcus chenjunshii]RFU52195.1 hypothetical protein DDV23_10980 [Streptococcus chenjunshii]
MDIRPKTLSIVQMVGYKEEGLVGVLTDEICWDVYALGQDFIEGMLDTVYSDGPVYFKSYPFSDLESVAIFTTFGNKITPTGEEVGPLLFEEKILIESDDFATFLSDNLSEYYEALASKYSGKPLDNLAVYHVLYHPSETSVVVDAYSSWEED